MDENGKIVEDGYTRFLDANEKEEFKKVEAMKKRLKNKAKDPSKVNVYDIEEAPANSKERWKAMQVLLVDFELLEEIEHNSRTKKLWKWS